MKKNLLTTLAVLSLCASAAPPSTNSLWTVELAWPHYSGAVEYRIYYGRNLASMTNWMTSPTNSGSLSGMRHGDVITYSVKNAGGLESPTAPVLTFWILSAPTNQVTVTRATREDQ